MKVILLVFPNSSRFTGLNLDHYPLAIHHFGLTHLIDVIASALCYNSECETEKDKLTEEALYQRIGNHWPEMDPTLSEEDKEIEWADREQKTELILAHLKQCVKDNQHIVPDGGYLRYVWACPYDEDGVSRILVIAKHYHAKEYTDQAFPTPVVRELP